MRESEAAGREQSGCPTPKHLHRLLYRPIAKQQSRTKGESNPSIFSLNAQRCVCLCVCACVCTCVCVQIVAHMHREAKLAERLQYTAA